jgi:hypothetical protein
VYPPARNGPLGARKHHQPSPAPRHRGGNGRRHPGGTEGAASGAPRHSPAPTLTRPRLAGEKDAPAGSDFSRGQKGARAGGVRFGLQPPRMAPFGLSWDLDRRRRPRVRSGPESARNAANALEIRLRALPRVGELSKLQRTAPAPGQERRPRADQQQAQQQPASR